MVKLAKREIRNIVNLQKQEVLSEKWYWRQKIPTNKQGDGFCLEAAETDLVKDGFLQEKKKKHGE